MLLTTRTLSSIGVDTNIVIVVVNFLDVKGLNRFLQKKAFRFGPITGNLSDYSWKISTLLSPDIHTIHTHKATPGTWSVTHAQSTKHQQSSHALQKIPSVLGCSSSKYEACAISMGSNEAPSKISVNNIYQQSKGFSISWLMASRK